MQGPEDADRAVLSQIREQVHQLCETGDRLLTPQYRHLLGRVEALIEITGIRPERSDAA